MYKDVFCFKIGMFSVKNNLGWVMNRTDNLYSCVGTFQGSSNELLITLFSFKQISNVCFFEQLISTTLFLNKPFITLLRFPSYIVLCWKPSQIPTCIIPKFIHCILLQNWNLGIINIIVPLAAYVSQLLAGWPSFPVIPPSILMPRFKENMGNGYKNTSNLQSNIYQINHPICTQAKQLKSHRYKLQTYLLNNLKLHPPAIVLAGTKCIYLIELTPKDIISY